MARFRSLLFAKEILSPWELLTVVDMSGFYDLPVNIIQRIVKEWCHAVKILEFSCQTTSCTKTILPLLIRLPKYVLLNLLNVWIDLKCAVFLDPLSVFQHNAEPVFVF